MTPDITDQTDDTRRRVLKAAAGTAVASTAVGTASADAPDSERSERAPEEVPRTRGEPSRVNDAIEDDRTFVRSLREAGLLDRSIGELKTDSLSAPGKDDVEGQLVSQTAYAGERVFTVRTIVDNGDGALNIVLHPDDDLAPQATLNYHDSDRVELITPADGDPSSLDRTVTTEDGPTSDDDDVSTETYGCLNCPTDDTCCRCVQVCVDNCNCSCTGIFEYRCKCCKYHDPRCWGDCY